MALEQMTVRGEAIEWAAYDWPRGELFVRFGPSRATYQYSLVSPAEWTRMQSANVVPERAVMDEFNRSIRKTKPYRRLTAAEIAELEARLLPLPIDRRLEA